MWTYRARLNVTWSASTSMFWKLASVYQGQRACVAAYSVTELGSGLHHGLRRDDCQLSGTSGSICSDCSVLGATIYLQSALIQFVTPCHERRCLRRDLHEGSRCRRPWGDWPHHETTTSSRVRCAIPRHCEYDQAIGEPDWTIQEHISRQHFHLQS